MITVQRFRSAESGCVSGHPSTNTVGFGSILPTGTLMQAHDMPFTKLINVDQGAREHFHVPKYQREYSWRKWQWEQILADIEDNDPGYFMGSIICVNEAQSVSLGDELIYEVVDGQQRLTTLSLLLAVIYAKLDAAAPLYAPDDPEEKAELQSTLTNIRAKVVKRKRDPRPGESGSFKIGNHIYFLRVQPSAQNKNLEDYLFLLSDAGLIEKQPKPAYCGNRLLARAYAYFFEFTPADVPSLLKLIAKINQLVFVQITVGSQSDAFTLFESLNNRGVPLSAMDIIKNKMLAEMERQHKVDIDESFARWQSIIEALPDANDQERFLRQFYNTFKHRTEIKVEKVPRATRSQIIRIYETLIKRNAEVLFDQLTVQADIYGKLQRAEIGTRNIADRLIELERIGSAPGYQVLLYLYSIKPPQQGDGDFFFKAVDLMTRYFIRRNVTDTPPTRQMDQDLISLIEACAQRVDLGNALTFEWFVAQLVHYAPPASLDTFKAALSGPIYDNNIAMARYVLIQIDQLHHSREYKPDFWARDEKGRFVWTVEHVLPQADRLPEHWVKMIGNGDRKRASELQEAYVHRLGNLTLSGYNSDLATAPFEKKQKLAKDRSFLGHKINIGYQNGLFLNAQTFPVGGSSVSLAAAPTWNVEMIEARTTCLVDIIVRANLLPGEKVD